MCVFVAACAVVTMFAAVNEPQYVRVVVTERDLSTAVDTSVVRININTATAEELQTLPGIGEVRALQIIAYREEHENGFLYIDELMNVQGIGNSIFERIRGSVYVG
jgi:competence protein ComEA